MLLIFKRFLDNGQKNKNHISKRTSKTEEQLGMCHENVS